MKLIAVRAILARAQAVFACLSAAALLAACSLPLPDKPVRPEPYDLGPSPAPSGGATASGAALAVDRVEANAAIDGTAIVYRLLYSGDGQQPRPYAQARWNMSPPQLVSQRLRDAFAATRPVVDVGMDCDTTPAGILNRRVRRSTGDIAIEDAMTRPQALAAMAAGKTAHDVSPAKKKKR